MSDKETPEATHAHHPHTHDAPPDHRYPEGTWPADHEGLRIGADGLNHVASERFAKYGDGPHSEGQRAQV